MEYFRVESYYKLYRTTQLATRWQRMGESYSLIDPTFAFPLYGFSMAGGAVAACADCTTGVLTARAAEMLGVLDVIVVVLPGRETVKRRTEGDELCAGGETDVLLLRFVQSPDGSLDGCFGVRRGTYVLLVGLVLSGGGGPFHPALT
jgi:hypothetical protein